MRDFGALTAQNGESGLARVSDVCLQQIFLAASLETGLDNTEGAERGSAGKLSKEEHEEEPPPKVSLAAPGESDAGDRLGVEVKEKEEKKKGRDKVTRKPVSIVVVPARASCVGQYHKARAERAV